MSIEVKTIGQLIDELITADLRIWHLVDRAIAGTITTDEAQQVQLSNQQRTELVRAIDRRLGERDIGGKVYADNA